MSRYVSILWLFCWIGSGWAADTQSLWAEAIWRSVAKPLQPDSVILENFESAVKQAETAELRAEVMVSLGDCIGMDDFYGDHKGLTVRNPGRLAWYRRAVKADPDSAVAWYRVSDLVPLGSPDKRTCIVALRRLMPDSALGHYLAAQETLAASGGRAPRAALAHLVAGNRVVFRVPATPSPAEYRFVFPKELGYAGAGWEGKPVLPRHFEPVAKVLDIDLGEMARCRAMARKFLAVAREPAVKPDHAIRVLEVVGDFGLNLGRNENRDSIWCLTGVGISQMVIGELSRIYESKGNQKELDRMVEMKAKIKRFLEVYAKTHLGWESVIDGKFVEQMIGSVVVGTSLDVTTAEQEKAADVVSRKLYEQMLREPKAVANALKESGVDRLRFTQE